MRFSIGKYLAAAALVAVCSAMLPGQTKTPLPAEADMTAQEKKNLQLVLDWWREVLQARHTELIDKYADPNLIQHNSNFGNTTGTLNKIVAKRVAVNPFAATLTNLPEIRITE